MTNWNAVGLAAYRRERKLVHLQYVGEMPGTPAGELETGDRLMWNGGAIYTIVKIERVSPQFIKVTERADGGSNQGQEYTRRLKLDRLVVRAKPGEKFKRAR
jgi:hypothetical protein